MVLFLIGGAVLLAAVAVISYPLIFERLQPVTLPPEPGEGGVATEYSESDALLEAMNELETSHQTGKVSQADFDAQQARLQRQYLAAVQAAEAQAPAPSGKAPAKKAPAKKAAAGKAPPRKPPLRKPPPEMAAAKKPATKKTPAKKAAAAKKR